MSPTAEQIALWEKEYSPSEWSKRFSTAAEVIDFHVKLVTDGIVDTCIDAYRTVCN